MKFNLRALELEHKLILFSVLVAVVSLFFNWVTFLEFKENGFEQEAYVLLLVFIYPAIQVYRGKHVIKKYGYLSAFIGAILGLTYLSMQTINEPGLYYRAWGLGPVLYTIACVLLAFGVWRTKK